MTALEDESELFEAENVEKYQLAGQLAHAALTVIMENCVPGADIPTLCAQGNAYVQGEAKPLRLARKAKIDTCYPTCITPEGYLGAYAPHISETLAQGQLIKVDIGVHVDGFVAMAGATMVVGGGAPVHHAGNAVSVAAYVAGAVIQRLLRPGVANADIAEVMHYVAEHYGVKPVKRLVSYGLKRYVSDSIQQVPMARHEPGDEHLPCGDFQFETGQAFAVDVRMTSGTGELKKAHTRTTVYKRDVDVTYSLRSDAAEKARRIIDRKFPSFHFDLAQLPDQRSLKLGLREMLNHGVLEPVDVLRDRKSDACFAAVRFTSLILNQRTVCITPVAMPTLDPATLPPFVAEFLSTDAESHQAGLPIAFLNAIRQATATPDQGDMAED